MCIICDNTNPKTGEYNMVVLNNLAELCCGKCTVPYKSPCSLRILLI